LWRPSKSRPDAGSVAAATAAARPISRNAKDWWEAILPHFYVFLQFREMATATSLLALFASRCFHLQASLSGFLPIGVNR
jgi:hypothetical protein